MTMTHVDYKKIGLAGSAPFVISGQTLEVAHFRLSVESFLQDTETYVIEKMELELHLSAEQSTLLSQWDPEIPLVSAPALKIVFLAKPSLRQGLTLSSETQGDDWLQANQTLLLDLANYHWWQVSESLAT